VCQGIDDPKLDQLLPENLVSKLRDDVEMVRELCPAFDQKAYLEGTLTPVYFGSAINTFGVKELLNGLTNYAPIPGHYETNLRTVDAHEPKVSGFVFKIQANMDRKHRDRVAFLRICSGRFERGMKVHHVRLNRDLRLAYANQFMARERETVDEAFAGDIVGIIDTGYFQIGDTVTDGKNIEFDRIPRFSPEIFGRLSVKDPLKRKQLQKGVQQLAEEGMIQLFVDPLVGIQDPVIGVVGELQMEVLMFRLNDEYKLDVRLERLAYSVARWPRRGGEPLKGNLKGASRVFHDDNNELVVLLEKEWDLRWLEKENPEVSFHISGRI
ncbi:MAG: peptide chain release factor 3, partial [Bdellovibrionales bacterium]|nr:peptide chain release factor 3 [Bdellovibrionales bacterium]